MVRLRSEFDGDIENRSQITDYRNAENRFELICENCGMTFYTDESTHEEWTRAVEDDHVRSFICPECEAAFEEAAVE